MIKMRMGGGQKGLTGTQRHRAGCPCKKQHGAFILNMILERRQNMEGKVLLYNSLDTKIGETYTRRARQLVKQQRASWVDDSQKAIRFAPGMENLDDAAAIDMHETEAMQGIDSLADHELMRFAKRRVHARFALRLHASISLILCVFFVVIYFLTDRGGYFWPVWPMLGLGLSVAIHGAITKIVVGDNMKERIILEYEQLKHRHTFVGFDDKRH